jgi:predicted CXXCH cytochrome family protein
MLQPATAASVKGDFSRGQLHLRGATYRVRERDGAHYITDADIAGQAREYRVDYTLGNRRVQHYLTTLPSGHIVVLAPTWDVLRKQWFHSLDIADPYQSGELHSVQVWNKNCYSCHVSRQENNFDLATNSYKTSWIDFGTNCERCHGPGSDHVAHYADDTNTPRARREAVHDIVLQTRLDPARNTMVCAQCHSLRDMYVQGFTAGSDYYDYFVPVIEFSQPVDRDPAYWPDGRTRRFSNDAFGLWQSECFLKGGATCLDCHTEAHDTGIERNPQLRPDANALCTRCHLALRADLTQHSHHRAESPGSSCVECHMPRTVLSIKAAIRDHSMSVPAPENTIRHAIPNACNVCHKNHDASWTLAQMNQWYSGKSRQKWIRRADVFSAARAGDPASIKPLTQIVAEKSEGPLARGNAVGYLGKFSFDPIALAALKKALTDSEPLVRAIAAGNINPGPADKEDATGALRHSLADPVATVRLAAAVSLVSLGVRQLADDDGRRFDDAKKLFEARAELNSDDPQQQLAAGKFYYINGDFAKAERAFASTLQLAPTAPAAYYLALALAQQHKIAQAREILQKISPADPQYKQAQLVLSTLREQ